MDQGRAGQADCGDAAGDAAAYHFVDGGLFDGRHRHSPSQAESWDEIASVNDEGPQRVQRFTDVIEHELPAIASIPTRVPIPLDRRVMQTRQSPRMRSPRMELEWRR